MVGARERVLAESSMVNDGRRKSASVRYGVWRRACASWLWPGLLVWGCQATAEPGALGEACNMSLSAEACVDGTVCISPPGGASICHARCFAEGSECGPDQGACARWTELGTGEDILACEYTWSTPNGLRPAAIGEACNYDSDGLCSGLSVCADGVCRALCSTDADCDGSGRCLESTVQGISICAGSAPSPSQPQANANGAVGGGDTDVSGGMVSTTVAVPEWTRQFGNAAESAAGQLTVAGVRVTREGEVLVVGHQTDGADANVPLEERLPGAFVRKYSRLGELMWSESFGYPRDYAHAVDADPSGNIVVAGDTGGFVTPRPGQSLNVPFVRKYDSSGNAIWTRQFEESFGYLIHALSVDGAGNSIVVGDTIEAVTGMTVEAQAFVRKYDPAGNELWSRRFGSAAADGRLGVSTDTAGNVVLAGRTRRPPPDNGFDAFVLKYDPNGNEIWTRQFGTVWSVATKIGVDRSNNVFVTGESSGALPGQMHVGDGGADAFVIKYDADGNELWSRQFGTPGIEESVAISTDTAGNVIVGGYTNGVLPQASGDGEIYLRKYDADGNARWTYQFGTDLRDTLQDVSAYDEGSVVVAGNTQGTLPGVQKPVDFVNGFVIMLAEASSIAPGGTSSGGTSSGGPNPGAIAGRCSVAAPPYPGQPACRNLLDEYVGQIDDCTCPTVLSAPASTYEPPVVVGTCTRDLYVSAALNYCWAAECFSFLGITQTQVDAGIASFTPASAAASAFDELEKADRLCSEAPVIVDPQTCPTLDLYPCGCNRGVCR